MKIYISTDSNEVKAIIEGKVPDNLIEDYDFSEDSIRLNGYSVNIINLPISEAARIQRVRNLGFNPLSFIGRCNEAQKACLVKKLVNEEQQFIAVIDKGIVEHYY